MNVLHLSRTMDQGGAEKIIFQLCSGTNDIFDNIVVASTGGVYVDKLKNNRVKHYVIPDMDKKNFFTIINILIKILIIVKREKINVIHSHHRMASFYARLVSIVFYKVSRLYTAHNIFHNKIKMTKFSLVNSEIIAVGEDVKKNLMTTFNIHEDNIQVIYNSISKPNVVDERNGYLEKLKSQDYYLVGNIGRISEQKGMEYFIRAIGIAKGAVPNVKGIIIGDGEQRKEMEVLIAELNLAEDVILLGYQDNIFDCISQLDFAVLSSLWEGFPLTPIEVFSMGKTIIATDIDGTNEIVENYYNGLLVPSKSTNKLADAIIELCLDSNLRYNLEKNAKLTYDKKFSYTNFLEEYKKSYIKYSQSE